MSVYMNIYISEGADYTKAVDIVGFPDTTGYIAYGKFALHHTSSKKYDITASISGTQVTIEIPSATNLLAGPGRYQFDIYVDTPAGNTYRVIEGELEILPGITVHL